MNLNQRLFVPSIFFLMLSMFVAVAGDDAADLHQKGVAALKDSQTKPDAIVAAARYFAQASALYEAAHKDELATEMNSYLYWCKKKMTIQQVDAFLKSADPAVSTRIYDVEKVAVEPAEAKAWLEKADAFARAHGDDHLLVAIRYFEVADRFAGTPISLDAQRKSLDHQQKATKVIGGERDETPVMPKSNLFDPVGNWQKGPNEILSFYQNKTLSFDSKGEKPVTGTWDWKDDILIINYDNRDWGRSTAKFKDANTLIERDSNVLRRIESDTSVSRPVNLLALIDPNRDAVAGKWSLKGETLIGEKAKFARLEIPYAAPKEYDFKIEFMRTEGSNMIGQLLLGSGRPFLWVIDGGNQSGVSGFENVEGRNFAENSSTFKSTALKNGQWHTSLVRVRIDSVTAFIDGKQIAQVKTNNFMNMTLIPEWRLRDSAAIGISHYDNKVVFKTIELVLVNGSRDNLFENGNARRTDSPFKSEHVDLDESEPLAHPSIPTGAVIVANDKTIQLEEILQDNYLTVSGKQQGKEVKFPSHSVKYVQYGDADSNFLAAVENFDNRKFIHAANYFRKALESGHAPKWMIAYCNNGIGLALFQSAQYTGYQGKTYTYDPPSAYFKKLLEFHPRSRFALDSSIKLSICLAKEQKFDEADAAIADATKRIQEFRNETRNLDTAYADQESRARAGLAVAGARVESVKAQSGKSTWDAVLRKWSLASTLASRYTEFDADIIQGRFEALLNTQDYVSAQKEAEEVLAKFRKGGDKYISVVPYVLFVLGTAKYSNGLALEKEAKSDGAQAAFADALWAFELLIVQFPKGQYVEEAHFYAGLCGVKLGVRASDDAAWHFNALLNKFPDSSFGKRAGAEIKALGISTESSPEKKPGKVFDQLRKKTEFTIPLSKDFLKTAKPLDEWATLDVNFVKDQMEKIESSGIDAAARQKLAQETLTRLAAALKATAKDAYLNARLVYIQGRIFAALHDTENAKAAWKRALDIKLTDDISQAVAFRNLVLIQLIKFQYDIGDEANASKMLEDLLKRELLTQDEFKRLILRYALTDAKNVNEREDKISILTIYIQAEQPGSAWSSDFAKAVSILITQGVKVLSSAEWLIGARGAYLSGEEESSVVVSLPECKKEAVETSRRNYQNSIDYAVKAIFVSKPADSRLAVEPPAWALIGACYLKLRQYREAAVANYVLLQTFSASSRKAWCPAKGVPPLLLAEIDKPEEGWLAVAAANFHYALDENARANKDAWNQGLKARLLKEDKTLPETAGPSVPDQAFLKRLQQSDKYLLLGTNADVAATQAAAAHNTVNLLAMLDPRKNKLVGRGKWQVFGDHLNSDNGIRGFVQIPYHPPEEYDFTVEFSMQQSRIVGFVLPGPNGQFEYGIGYNNMAGFEMVSGKRVDSNESSRPFTIVANRRYKTTIKVRKSGVSAFIDDQLISELKTDFKNLSLHPHWVIPDQRAFAVTNDVVVTIFYAITLTEISGPGEIVPTK